MFDLIKSKRTEKQAEPEPEPKSVLDQIGTRMRQVINGGEAELPLPGSGETMKRWQVLAELGSQDLSLAKVFESHADALAILAELREPYRGKDLMAVWTVESREPLHFDEGRRFLTGSNPWCCGASIVDEALVAAVNDDGRPVLVRVRMDDPNVTVGATTWTNPGLADAGSRLVKFDRARAVQVGAPGAYLERPGFWHGMAGVTAMWYGAAVSIANSLLEKVRHRSDPHAEAHLGFIHSRLEASRIMLRWTAHWIDSHPTADAFSIASSLRAVVENAATETIQRGSRALGPSSLSIDAEHAKQVADLEILLRQCHAERELAVLGATVMAKGSIEPW